MWQYIKSKEFLLILAGLFVAGLLLFFGFFFIFLPIYTHHGESVLVPEVVKMDLEEAEEILTELDLKLVVSDSVYTAGMAPLAVISQEPQAMSKVKPGRKIYLTINKTVPPMVRLPNVEEVSNYQAKLSLDNWKIGIRQILYEPHDHRNLVLRVEMDGKVLKPGDLIPKYSRVDLVVGKGLGNQRVATPELVGLAYQNAVSLIHESGLNVGAYRFKPESKEKRGTVIQQYPGYIEGDSVKLGSSIDLFIAGPEPEESLEGQLEEEVAPESD